MYGGAPCLDRAAEWGGDRVQHRNAPGGVQSPPDPSVGRGPQSRQADSTRIRPTSSTSGCLGCRKQAQAELGLGAVVRRVGRELRWRQDVAAGSVAATRGQHSAPGASHRPGAQEAVGGLRAQVGGFCSLSLGRLPRPAGSGGPRVRARTTLYSYTPPLGRHFPLAPRLPRAEPRSHAGSGANLAA